VDDASMIVENEIAWPNQAFTRIE